MKLVIFWYYIIPASSSAMPLVNISRNFALWLLNVETSKALIVYVKKGAMIEGKSV